jgi:VWFA-related protein
VLVLPIAVWSQQAPPPSSPAPSSTPIPAPGTTQSIPEITSHDENATFKVKVNLVQVRVVVRDSKGQAIGGLKQEDFRLFDNGKPQAITRFSTETAGSKAAVPTAPAAVEANAPNPTSSAAATIPQVFVAYLFDDVHTKLAELTAARNAAVKQVQLLGPEYRAGVFTTSGLGQQDFTDNHEQLVSAMNRIMARSQDSRVYDCPSVTYYQADQILNKNDSVVQSALMQATAGCTMTDSGVGPESPQVQAGVNMKVAMLVNDASLRALEIGDRQVHLVLSAIQGLVRRMAELPGQRMIVLVSPGLFMASSGDLQWTEADVMQHAVNSKVVINTMDARGLYTRMPDGSESQQSKEPLLKYDFAEQDAKQDALADIADATGGRFFHNNNDFDEGFRQLAAPPEYSYVLGFSPQNLKFDGHYHKLKVSLTAPGSLTVRARKGYYAPKAPADASEQARQDIEDAVLSREEIRDIPVELHTQFFKPSAEDAKLSVVARLDVRRLHFQKASGRNNNDVTVVSVLFDRNGNFVAGTEKVLQLHLKDETLDGRLGSGITLKSSFDVKPGIYVVRLVVRGQDGQLAAQNSSVEIP